MDSYGKKSILLTFSAVGVQFFRWVILGAALKHDVIWSGCSAMVGTLVALIPVSIAGLGTREATLEYLFRYKGIQEGIGVAFSLIMFSSYLIGAMAGVILLFISKKNNH